MEAKNNVSKDNILMAIAAPALMGHAKQVLRWWYGVQKESGHKLWTPLWVEPLLATIHTVDPTFIPYPDPDVQPQPQPEPQSDQSQR